VKIIVEAIGLPALAGAIGRRAEIELEGEQLGDLVGQIVRGLPPPARQVLLDREGRLDGSVQVMVNEEGFIPRSRFSDLRLAEGDRVRFLLLACGG
jgi:sulfur carrier protein ThiS